MEKYFLAKNALAYLNGEMVTKEKKFYNIDTLLKTFLKQIVNFLKLFFLRYLWRGLNKLECL